MVDTVGPRFSATAHTAWGMRYYGPRYSFNLVLFLLNVKQNSLL